MAKKKKKTKKVIRKKTKKKAAPRRKKTAATRRAPKKRTKTKARPKAAKKTPRKPRKRKALPSTYFHPGLFAGKRGCVLGMGRSGMAVAKLLSKKGFKVLVSDTRPHKDLRKTASKLPGSVKWEGKGHSDRVLQSHFVVKSPGISPANPIFAKLKEAGIPVFSELEVALAFCRPKEIFAITGTNGKTTAVNMLAAICRAARRKAHVFGNIGEPLATGATKIKKTDTLILETSSYQLEDSRWFRPTGAAILNLTSDHIDHHGSLEAYRVAKGRICADQDRSQSCIFNADDALVYQMARGAKSQKLFFGREASSRVSCWLDKKKIKIRLPREKKTHTITPPKLPGAHNLENAMAVALLALSRGLTPAAINKGFAAFKGVEHRIEDLGARGSLHCVNDSKATNIDSTLACLRALNPKLEGKVLLILGGRQKGGGFTVLKPWVERYAKAVLAIGSSGPKVEEDLQGASHVFPCANLETAVQVAYQIGQKGEMLLLSPACASFDQFASFEERGNKFKELVGQRGKR
jgi:UDP-N-acetylmuramoylalanine--D-glutamate ligase